MVALLDVFYKTWEYNTNLFFFLNLLFYYVSYIHLYYFKKFTNLPVYSGLINPHQISLKTKGFISIPISACFYQSY